MPNRQLPNVAERLHEILANERSGAVRRGHCASERPAAPLAHHAAARRRAAAAAARVARLAARRAAARRARPVQAVASFIVQLVQALLRVDARPVVLLVDLLVERVHVRDVLVARRALVAERPHEAVVARRAESQSNDAVLFDDRYDGL